MTIQTCLHTLELESALDPDQLHRAYRRQVKRWHPDQFAHQPAIRAQAEERLKRINHAYATLKQHLKKNVPPDPTDSRPKASRPENGPQAQHPKAARTFPWSQWFKSKNRQRCQKNESQTPKNKAKAKCKASNTRNKNCFENILREAADSPFKPGTSRRIAAHPLRHPHLLKKRKGGMRIEGFPAVNPITPVRPVSKINAIEGSD